MYKVSVKNEVTGFLFMAQFETESAAKAWISEQVSTNSWGKPERVSKTDEGLFDRVIDVIEVAETDREPAHQEFKIKADYVIVEKDLSSDYEYLLAECQSKRAAEYPALEDYMDAKVKQASSDPAIKADGEVQEFAYLDACLAVKAKYPKPVQA